MTSAIELLKKKGVKSNEIEEGGEQTVILQLLKITCRINIENQI